MPLSDQGRSQAPKQDAPEGQCLPGRMGAIERMPLLADDVQLSRAEHLAFAASR